MRKESFNVLLRTFGLLMFFVGDAIAEDLPASFSRATGGFGPSLAAASNFGHGWNPTLLDQAIQLGVRDFRDIVYWQQTELAPGEYSFDSPETMYPEQISVAEAQMSLTVNWGNEMYDEGFTPYTDEGRLAFAHFVVAVLDRFPAISAVEVGNEFNGQNFVSGPILDLKRADRAAVYFDLLKSVYTEVKASHPDVAVLGGAVHSVPAGYLWPLLDLGAADYMDALVLHPYTTPPEQLMRQITVLRRHPKASDLPIQVTEFGHESRTIAPGFLLRMYCAMALSGVERAAWYPLSDRGDGLQPLIDPLNGRPTAAGRAYALAQGQLVGLPVVDVSPDPFTYACLFGGKHLVIWGEPRAVTVADDVVAVNATGVTLDPVLLRLSMTDPLLISSDAPIEIGGNVRLAPTDIIADSYHQFAFPDESQKFATSDPFRRFARRGEKFIKLKTMPGQESPGTLWTPYLGNRYIRPARLTAESLVPGGGGEDEVEIVHQYVAAQPQEVAIDATWSPADHSDGGIDITIRAGDSTLFHKDGVTMTENVSLPRVSLKKGETLDFIIGPGATSDGDLIAYRIILREAE